MADRSDFYLNQPIVSYLEEMEPLFVEVISLKQYLVYLIYKLLMYLSIYSKSGLPFFYSQHVDLSLLLPASTCAKNCTRLE